MSVLPDVEPRKPLVRTPQLPCKPVAISFDLDGTLWDVYPVLHRANEVWHEYCAVHYPQITAAYTVDSFRHFVLELGQDPANKAFSNNLTWVRREAIRRVVQECGYSEPSCVEELLAVWRNARNQVKPFAGVDEVLRELRGMGLKLVTLTNGNCQAATVPILAEVCDFHLNVDSCGTAKPDPAMFQLMLDTLKLEPAQVVHVGDDLIADVFGAARLGITTIWTDYNHKLYESMEESAEKIVETREGGVGLLLPDGVRSLGDRTQVEASVLAAESAAYTPHLHQFDAVIHNICDLPNVIRNWTEMVERA